MPRQRVGCEDGVSPAFRDRLLFARYRDPSDRVDREALVERFLPLARQSARRFSGGSEPYDDLLQVASVALMRAIDRFDPERHVAFSSYAMPTIAGEIKRYYRDRTWAVRVPRNLQELARRVEDAREGLTGSLGRSPSTKDLAEAVDAPEEDVLEAQVVLGAYTASSLDFPRDSQGRSEEVIRDTLRYDETGYDRAEQRAVVERLLARLTRREREVVRLRFEEDLSQREIGERIGVSQMQVSRTLRGALLRLQWHVRLERLTSAG